MGLVVEYVQEGKCRRSALMFLRRGFGLLSQ